MSGISTHVLDTSRGVPAAGVPVELHFQGEMVGSGRTDRDGRIPALLPGNIRLQTGEYRLVFDTKSYFPEGFYPEVIINFMVNNETVHHHIPLLISPFTYTTYRGS